MSKCVTTAATCLCDRPSMLARRLAASPRCVRLFRALLGLLVAAECADKWPTLEWLYTDAGALPRAAVLPPFEGEGLTTHPSSRRPLSLPHTPLSLSLSGITTWLVCVHCWAGSLRWARALAVAQVLAAAALAADVHPVASGLLCWWLHCSWCLRNGVPPPPPCDRRVSTA